MGSICRRPGRFCLAKIRKNIRFSAPELACYVRSIPQDPLLATVREPGFELGSDDMAIAAQLPVTDDPAVLSGAPAQTAPLNEDDSLLRRIGQGDERAFRSLVERHVDKAYALALRIRAIRPMRRTWSRT